MNFIFIFLLFYFFYNFILCYGMHRFLSERNTLVAKLFYAFFITINMFSYLLPPVFSNHWYECSLAMILILSMFIYYDGFYKRMFYTLFFQEISYSVVIIYTITFLILMEKEDIYGIGNVLFILLVIILAFIYYLIKKHHWNDTALTKQEWRNLFYITCIYQVLLYLIAIFLTVIDRNLKVLFLLFTILLFALFLLCLWGFYDLAHQKEKTLLDAIHDANHKLITLIDKQIHDVYDDNRKLKHDLKNHVIILENFIKQNEKEEALNYLHSISHAVQQDITTRTNHSPLNYILNQKSMIIYNKNIAYQKHIYDDLTFIDPMDIVVILGNLLDNAIEASQFVEQPWIFLSIEKKSDNVMITIKNRCQNRTHSEKNQLIKTYKKGNEHGFGLKSIISSVKKYDGTYSFAFIDDYFQFVIEFPVGKMDDNL